MEIMSFADFRKNLADTMDRVLNDRNSLVITSRNHEPVVLMSLKDFNAYEETVYLLSSPANAKGLRRSIADANVGKLIEVQE